MSELNLIIVMHFKNYVLNQMNLVGILGYMEKEMKTFRQGRVKEHAALLHIKNTHSSRHFTSICWNIIEID